MQITRTNPEGVSRPQGVFCHTVRAGNTLFISGQTARDQTRQIVGTGDPMAQARQVHENVKICLAAHGLGLDRLVMIRTYVTSPAYLAPVVAVRREFFDSVPFPASTMAVVSALAHPDLLVEMDAVAVFPEA